MQRQNRTQHLGDHIDVKHALKLEEDTLVIKEIKDINVFCMTNLIFDSIQDFDFVIFCDMWCSKILIWV